jgi:adenylate cyclase, class 1
LLPEGGGDRARIYVLDEQGALFEEESGHCPDVERLAGRYAELFGAMRARRMCHGEAHATSPVELAVEYQRLERLPGGAYRAVPFTAHPGESGYLDVQVIGSRDAGGSRHYTLYCRDQEFSSREPGGDPFTAAARYVLGLRRGGERYPIFITDLELAESTPETGAPTTLPTSRRLEHKRIVEGLLNRALTALAQAPDPPASVPATSA